MATEHTAVGVRRKVKLLVPISGLPVVVSWSDFTVALSQAVRVRLALQTARSRTRESVRCTKSPRPTVLEVFDGSVLESVRYETATSPLESGLRHWTLSKMDRQQTLSAC